MRVKRRVVARPTRVWPPAGLPGPRRAYRLGPEDEYASSVVQPFVDTAALERVAARVVGVHSCRVERRADEPVPQAVRVVARLTRRTAVAKDIQSAWYAMWGLYVPRRLFVVTPIRSPRDLWPRRVRLQLCQVGFEHSGDEVAATVALFARGRTLEGRATLPAATADVRRLAAEAAVAALAGAVPAPYVPALLELRRLHLGGAPAIACAVGGPRGEALLGICLVRGDEREAAVRAVLDAVNRVVLR